MTNMPTSTPFRQPLVWGCFFSTDEWFTRWYEARKTASKADDASRYWKHLSPIIGNLSASRIERKNIERVVAHLDSLIESDVLSSKTCAHVWSLLKTMCDDMCYSKNQSFRTLSVSPCVNVRGPESGVSKSKQYLTSNEFSQLMACPAVSLEFRRLIAVAVYTGLRANEMCALADTDIHDGIITVRHAVERMPHRDVGTVRTPKNGTLRRLPMHPHLADIWGSVGSLKVPLNAAELLREACLKAEITRSELHSETLTSKPLTWHDLRSNFITWSLMSGVSPLVVQARAGHASHITMMIYVRCVENLGRNLGDPFPTLEMLK